MAGQEARALTYRTRAQSETSYEQNLPLFSDLKIVLNVNMMVNFDHMFMHYKTSVETMPDRRRIRPTAASIKSVSHLSNAMDTRTPLNARPKTSGRGPLDGSGGGSGSGAGDPTGNAHPGGGGGAGSNSPGGVPPRKGSLNGNPSSGSALPPPPPPPPGFSPPQSTAGAGPPGGNPAPVEKKSFQAVAARLTQCLFKATIQLGASAGNLNLRARNKGGSTLVVRSCTTASEHGVGEENEVERSASPAQTEKGGKSGRKAGKGSGARRFFRPYRKEEARAKSLERLTVQLLARRISPKKK